MNTSYYAKFKVSFDGNDTEFKTLFLLNDEYFKPSFGSSYTDGLILTDENGAILIDENDYILIDAGGYYTYFPVSFLLY